HECRYALAVPLDHGDRAPGGRAWLLDRAAGLVDPTVAVPEPVDDLERRVAQRLGECIVQRGARVEREQDVRGERPVEPLAEANRHQRWTMGSVVAYAMSARMPAPDSSAFGTKPRAPLESMSEP